MDHYSTKENKCRFNEPEWQKAEEQKQVIPKGMNKLQRNASDPNSQRHYFNFLPLQERLQKKKNVHL